MHHETKYTNRLRGRTYVRTLQMIVVDWHELAHQVKCKTKSYHKQHWDVRGMQNVFSYNVFIECTVHTFRSSYTFAKWKSWCLAQGLWRDVNQCQGWTNEPPVQGLCTSTVQLSLNIWTISHIRYQVWCLNDMDMHVHYWVSGVMPEWYGYACTLLGSIV